MAYLQTAILHLFTATSDHVSLYSNKSIINK